MNILVLPSLQNVDADGYALARNLCTRLEQYEDISITAIPRKPPETQPNFEVNATNADSSFKHFQEVRSYLKQNADDYDLIQASIPFKQISPVATISTETPIIYAPLEDGHSVPYDHFKEVLIPRLTGRQLPHSLVKPLYLTATTARDILNPVRKKLYAWQINQAEYYIGVTEHTTELLDSLTNNKTQSQTIHHGVRLDTFTLNEEERPQDSFVYFGRLTKRKNISDAIKALDRMNNPAELHICGKGPEKERLENLTDELNLSDSVYFHGFVSTDELVTIIQNSTASIQPSTSEGYYMTRLESLACGTPVISSDLPLCSDLKDEDGFITPEEMTPNGFAHEMDDFVTESTQIQPSSCRMSAEKYNWDNIAAKYIDIYKNCI